MSKETLAIFTAEGLFTERPSLSDTGDIIAYLMTRESYSTPEDADGEPVKRYALVCTITVEEIEK